MLLRQYFLICCFNSIKVRLIRPLNVATSTVFNTFQFHKGSINTIGGGVSLVNSLAFQFHKGSINTADVMDSEKEKNSFNSIKVRLILYYH